MICRAGSRSRPTNMARLIPKPTVIQAAGNKPKLIEEFIGRVNSQTDALSIARMHSPAGWVEPGQTPEFDEYTIVLRGSLRVKTKDGVIYIAVCLPAFSLATVHRDQG